MRSKSMNLYIDTEFNGFNGELISIALVSEDDQEFYEVISPWEIELKIDPWVMENVIPILNKKGVPRKELQIKLREFLSQFDHCNIIADWHEDIIHFCSVLTNGPGTRIETPDLSFKIKRIDAPSKIPHNALEDARGIKQYLSKNAQVN